MLCEYPSSVCAPRHPVGGECYNPDSAAWACETGLACEDLRCVDPSGP
jgi:hypothetical protein